jgi:hypothetical protein
MRFRMITALRRSRAFALAGGIWLLLPLPMVCAQQAPAPPPEQAGGNAQEIQSAPQAAPGPVGGIEDYRVQGPGLGRSYYSPRLVLLQGYDTNPGFASTTGASQADAVTAITGGITLQALQRNSAFSLDYSSTGIIYDTQAQSNAVIQQLGVTEKLTLRRWDVVIRENFNYLPASGFALGGLGFTGGSSAGLPGTGGTAGFNPYLQPSQTIGSGNVSQLSSSSAFQAQYNMRSGSSVSGSVVAGFEHFFDSGMLNSRNIFGRFGYDAAITRRDTFSMNVVVSRLDYSSGQPGFTSYSFQAGYRRYLTGRLLVSVLAGPMISHFTPAPGQTTVTGGENLVNWSLLSNLSYRTRRGSISMQYTHGVGAGSGFLVGSLADQVSASFTREFSRNWSGVINGGYARNSSLEQTTPGTTGSTSLVFNNWFGGVSFVRSLGRYSKLSFNYNASRQTGDTATCANMQPCGPVALVQVVGVTLNWSSRPLKFE